MPDDHGVKSKFEFLAWVELELAKLDADDREQPAITGDRYYDVFDDAVCIAAVLGLSDILESIGARPPAYALGGNQQYLKGIRGQIRAKLSRIQGLLAPAQSRDADVTSIADDVRQLAERIGGLSEQIIESFKFPTPHDRVRHIREITGRISHDAFPLITWIERNRPAAADLEKRRLMMMEDGADNCAASNTPEYVGGKVAPFADGARPSAGARMTAEFYVFCNMFGLAIRGWADEIEVASASPKTGTDGPWSTPDSPSQWAKVFNVSRDTLMRRFRDGKIRHRRLTSKSYQIHVDDLPSGHKSA
jgi:hypothetical protein